MLRLSLELLTRDRRIYPTLVMVDELQNLPRMDSLLKGIALYRAFGVRFLLMTQFLAGLKRLYGESYREFLGCENFCLYGPTSDLETLRLFSELIGSTQSDSVTSSTDLSKVAGGELGASAGLSSREYPLLSPAMLRMIAENEALALLKNLPPIKFLKQRYFEDPELRSKAGADPFRR